MGGPAPPPPPPLLPITTLTHYYVFIFLLFFVFSTKNCNVAKPKFFWSHFFFLEKFFRLDFDFFDLFFGPHLFRHRGGVANGLFFRIDRPYISMVELVGYPPTTIIFSAAQACDRWGP